ncbi:hypothetical protein [Paenirhodobacter sp.]|uniref:hypothetical protein n=1 Tax=Paenirhodobacter sp. TaxID=1965326 RepID=UPI003B507CFD
MAPRLAPGPVRVRSSNGRGRRRFWPLLAAKYTRRSGRAFDAGNFLCFPGTQTALAVVMQGAAARPPTKG